MVEEDDDKRLLELELRAVIGTPDEGLELGLGLGLVVGMY